MVGNAKKYSITQAKAREQQTAKLTQRSMFYSRRDYGEVFVRNKVDIFIDYNPINIFVCSKHPDHISSVSNLDEDRRKTEEKLRDKIQRKNRLVKFEKTRQGSAVIHRRVNLSGRAMIAPQQAIYEENLEPVPPLIYVQNASPDEPDSIPFESTRSSTLDQRNEKSEITMPIHSVTALSSIEEESEEFESTGGIAFKLTNQDSFTKKSVTDEKERPSDFLRIDDVGKSFEESSIQQRRSPVEIATEDEKIQKNEPVVLP